MLIFDQLKKSEPQLRMLAIGILAGMGVLLGGLWYVQVASAQKFRENLQSQSYRSVRVPAVRGKILDRNGLALAENQPSYNVHLYLEELRPLFQEEYRRRRPPGRLSSAAISQLGRETRYHIVSNIVQHVGLTVKQPLEMDERNFRRHYEQSLPLPLTVLERLSPQQIAHFLELPRQLPGLDLDVHPSRFYPYGQSAAHVIGYMQRDDTEDESETSYHYRLPDFRGVLGIEGAFDPELRGQAGVKSVLVNNLNYRQGETLWAPADPGKNVVLTLDLPLQQAVEKALASAGPRTRGAAVVMDPRNGDILAMASAPAFDPNQFVPRITPEYWEQMQDPALRPQINRATQGIYPPGSIFKSVVALACLEAGILDPAVKIHNPGFIHVGKRPPIKDTAPPGEYDFNRAFIRSSNTYFIHYGLKVRAAAILEMGRRFHLGERTGIPTRQEQAGFFPTAKDTTSSWYDGDTANLSIGQGAIAVTPLQMAIMTAALVNGGKVFWPRLVDRLESAEGREGQSERFPVRLRSELGVRAYHLRLLRDAMRDDVEHKEGSGQQAAVPGMDIGGKTGTAQITAGRRQIDKITWFAAYGAPAAHEPARYVVVVMVESGGSGGTTCAPIAKRIFQALQKREQQGRDAPAWHNSVDNENGRPSPGLSPPLSPSDGERAGERGNHQLGVPALAGPDRLKAELQTNWLSVVSQ